jgi:hypothetical protein
MKKIQLEEKPITWQQLGRGTWFVTKLVILVLAVLYVWQQFSDAPLRCRGNFGYLSFTGTSTPARSGNAVECNGRYYYDRMP